MPRHQHMHLYVLLFSTFNLMYVQLQDTGSPAFAYFTYILKCTVTYLRHSALCTVAKVKSHN